MLPLSKLIALLLSVPGELPPPPEPEGQLHWTNLCAQCSVPLGEDSRALSGQADIRWVPSQPCSHNGLPLLGISLSVNQLIHFPWFPRSSSLAPRSRLTEITTTRFATVTCFRHVTTHERLSTSLNLFLEHFRSGIHRRRKSVSKEASRPPWSLHSRGSISQTVS